jgi:protein farnesyltransferase/geranylgeranyltransferase type-1 subunit alpha
LSPFAFVELFLTPIGRLYRASIIKALHKDLREELQWLNRVALRRSKNYQIWQHRQNIVNDLSELPLGEVDFLATVLGNDAKNYHVWSYRQWLVQRFDLWPPTQTTDLSSSTPSELSFTETLLEEDVYNNSAWNHRFFVLFGRDKVDPSYQWDPTKIADAVWDHEIQFAKEKILLAPQNISSWNYIQGVQRKCGRELRELEDFTLQFGNPDRAEDVRSSHALDLIADIRATSKSDSARRALDLLAERFDPIRANYWKWRMDQLPSC